MSQNIIITTDEKHVLSLIDEATRQNRKNDWPGHSMLPLRSGRDYIDLIAVNDDTVLRKNDVILYMSHNGNFVLHRIYTVTEEGYFTNGDGNLSLEPC